MYTQRTIIAHGDIDLFTRVRCGIYYGIECAYVIYRLLELSPWILRVGTFQQWIR